MEKVILVDLNDQVLGEMEKMEAHRKGLLHRAFSVFILNSSNELLLHQRAWDKYHSGGLWTNACCSHPRPGENLINAGKRRLFEEMGLKADLKELYSFIYRAELDCDLTEHEFDHVLLGYSDEIPSPASEEVAAWKYISIEEIKKDLKNSPENYTFWFKETFPNFLEHIERNSMFS